MLLNGAEVNGADREEFLDPERAVGSLIGPGYVDMVSSFMLVLFSGLDHRGGESIESHL
jgi:hypothetical protein